MGDLFQPWHLIMIAIIVVVAIGVLGWPLVPVVSVVVPLSIVAAALERRA